MSSEIILIFILFFAIFALFYLLFTRQIKKLTTKEEDHTLTQWLQSMQSTITSSNQNLNQTLQRSYQDLHQRLEMATQVMGDLKKEAGTFSEVGRSMRDLQEFLKSPKLRGNIGEQVLKDLISQMFPKSSFFLQHHFSNGSIVDAAIKTDAGILPIDSKFPMENFQKYVKSSSSERDFHSRAFIRDVKKHVKDISTKYILPSEGTMDFALMYLPSESVYYEIANQPDILDYARVHRVYPVSPTTLYAHLQTILLSFEGKKIESKSKEVFGLLRGIQSDYGKLEDNLNLLSKHLSNAYNQMSNTNQTFTTLGQKLTSARTLGSSQTSQLEEEVL